MKITPAWLVDPTEEVMTRAFFRMLMGISPLMKAGSCGSFSCVIERRLLLISLFSLSNKA
jgi:hypothetical protein